MSRSGLNILQNHMNVNGYPPPPPTDGLVAYWPFSGNANDAIGTNHGTVVNATLTTGVKGLVNTAYAFNGTTSYIQTVTTPCPSTGSFSVSIWFKNTSIADVTMTAFSCGWWTVDMAFLIMLDGWGYGNTVGGWTGAVYVSGLLPINIWHHVVIMRNNTTPQTYVDGVKGGDGPNLAGTLRNNYCGCFGANIDSSLHRHFAGSIAQTRVYNRVLTAEEVLVIYNYEK